MTSLASSQVIQDYRRQLHEEEVAYFANVTGQLREKADARIGTSPGTSVSQAAAAAADGLAAEAVQFGDRQVSITGVSTARSPGETESVFFPGDKVEIRIDCAANTAIDHLNIGVRIRNKEGVKLYSWGTLNQDQKTARDSGGAPSDLFWNRSFQAGESFSVTLRFDCRLGANLYEIQAYATQEGDMDFSSQRMLHWIDEAAFFQVIVRRDENFFGGVIDLGMAARW